MTIESENPIKASFSINVLENTENEILLLKRQPNAELGPGLWGFSAGHIKIKETPEECAWRELHEEIGANIDVKLIKQFGPVRDSFYGGVYQVYLFHFHWIDGNIILNPEHNDYAWVGSNYYKIYEVMDGMDEDLYYLDIWPKKFLNQNKLPASCR